MARFHGDSRYLNTINARQQRFRRRQPLGVGGGQVDHQADDGGPREVAATNPEPTNFDQARQFAGRADPQRSAALLEMDTIVADQHRRCDLPRASGQDEIERQPRLAGT